MGEAGGRRRDKVWEHFTSSEGGKVKCKHCGEDFAATTSATRLKAHINKLKGRGIQVCTGFPQSNNFVSREANSNNDLEHNLLPSQGQTQADDAEDQERIQGGSSFVSNEENEDLLVKRYVFECLRLEDTVFISPLSFLTQQDFITLKPETPLDSLVIDIFVEILTDIERKKKSIPSNWYLPVTFSDKALEGNVGHFLNFVHGHKMRENYMSDLEFCEKIFIPVHDGARPNGGHFYLYIIHVKNKQIEIWDSLPNTSVAEIGRDETTKKLLLVMEKLFEKVTFTKFHSKMTDDILLQPNRFDSGIFVIKYMEQSDHYVKRNHSFQFDSQKEREDLALKLLNNDLNQEKQNLYDKARRRYARVEKQDGNKRLRVDDKDVGSELEAEYDGLEVIRAYFRDISGFNTSVSFLDENWGLRSFDLTLGDASDGYDMEINREGPMKRITFEGLGNRKAVLPQNIKELFIKKCHQETAAGSLCSVLSYGPKPNNNPHQIEWLDIRSCKDVEYLCCFSGSCPFCSSSQLVGRLSLYNLMDLKDLVSPYALLSLHQSSLFSHLTYLSISECHSMETLMTPKLLALFRNLRTIEVSDCGKMKQIVGEDHYQMILTASADLVAPPEFKFLTLAGLSDLKDLVSPDALLSLHQSSLFSHLTYLSISECHSMETLMTPKLLALFRNLRTIYVSDCRKMKQIVGEDHYQMILTASAYLVAPPEFKFLTLTGLSDLKDLVSPDALLSLHQSSLFSHLTYLSISKCHSMETLMTPKLLALLRNLRTIEVSDCGKMKEIVGVDHSEMELTAITLPKLTSLKLFDMPELNFVYRGIMLCPSLQTFSIVRCKLLNPPQIEISNGCELPMKRTSTGYDWEK